MSFEQSFRIENIKNPEKKVKEGVDFVFEQNQELNQVGTKDEYSNYLDTIFQESKLKDIVYHGGTLNPQDRGKDYFTRDGDRGLYFTGSKSRARSYIDKSGNKEYKEKSKIFTVLLNIKNPLDKKIWSKWKFGLDRISDKEYQIIKENNSDGLINQSFIKYNTQYVVLEQDQIYILGSKEDLDNFKNFILKHREV